MFLKRLDIAGFKSFAEKSSVDFVPGVTAVVGPNGSGKSNITDSIRWVLGEQSAKSLRGSKMEDIIFAGSDSRKSLNFAEVTLTLDNEDQFLPLDYNEVSVTRRVYRSGDSEFYINSQSCRLKDIIDLFMDSGLGREAFSIISQGKVEEILNSKAEDRRSIFEEAAGVLKYKTRKKKAEAKLLETQENLNRVNDIVYELESQVEPLKIQSSIAKDYLQQKEELEKIEVALTAFEIEDLHGKWEALSAVLEKLKKEEEALGGAIGEKEAEIEVARAGIADLDESINDLQGVLLHASEELEKLEGRKEVLKERKKNASHNKEQLKRNIEELGEKEASLKERKAMQQEIADVLQREAAELQKKLREKQAELKLYSENTEEKIDSLKSDYIELLNRQAAFKNEFQYIGQQLAQQGARSTRLESDNEKFLSERKQIEDQKKEIIGRLEQIQGELEEQVRLFKNEQAKTESLKTNYQKQETTLYQAYQYLQQAKSRKDMLEELEEDYSGFFQGVKEVLKARGGALKGIEGAIAELIAVPKQYETAIETALGGAMQHVVVANEENGRSAIQFLKKHSYGRATFLPLNVIKGKSLSQGQLQSLKLHPSFIGAAADLVSFDSKYEEVVKNLLGNVIVSKDLKGANEMAKILNYRSRFVTMEGDVVNPGGSMTGGAVKQKSSSLLSRKTELEELKERLAEMDSKTQLLEEQVRRVKGDINKQEELIENLRRSGEELRLKENSLKGDLREVEMAEKNINERLSLYDMDKSQSAEESQKLSARKSALELELEKMQKSITGLEEEIEVLTQQKNTRMTSKETLMDMIGELKITLASKNEQLNFAKDTFASIEGELAETSEKLQTFKEDLSLLSSELTSSSSGEEVLEEAARKKLKDKQEAIDLISSRKEERLKLQETLEDLELSAKELRRLHKGMTESMKDEEVRLNRLDVELDNRLAHLREEYLLTFEAAREEYPLHIPAEEARKKVKLIKLSIEELGTVNLGSIEEYERVSERYEFLLAQKNDLQEAKDTLFQVIDEMDEEMKKRFRQTFEGIRFHFESVFQALFGGGRADLKLTQPDDLLNTGVDIVAQPPGKKLQNLGLLSGGERALTAIALLFSILKVRPVPFCILDEVEAALDEANVQRFSQYLKRYSEETQFIVITHRKGTMEEADVLYGVTMQESGVSKLVSVRLEETRELVPQ
ncbi:MULTISPECIES: chromosome segregation protein SMC [Bacillus]|uniref:Chromosome partition protein Smc n=1 Tax=Bacillus infantis NRRL B-14911 TaxID=1367477 RepID=U5L7M0_9BACI|nr:MULTISPECIES: chromosome segregation protein SMC [Bacillus]AGX03824.1 chromosome partitioning protein Smc [Bacillus infantis NRRL B-14911]EAR65765.1 Smc [Bacillus sp. NRRL B-14911]MCA1034656.1 chromosome segregation protein SMC [Bacillus infantis]PLR71374.1 chromosome segregation protein SMC [Bacillus sp. UMB0728]